MDYNRKELVDWVRGIYQNLDEADKQDALRFFPELRESEDERIRKFLVKHVSEWIGCIEHDLKFSSKDVESEEELAMFKAGLAYLEKQKEQNCEDEECTDFTIYHPLKNGKGKYECTPYSFYGSLTSFSEDKDLIDFLRTCFYTEEECNEWIEQQKEQKPESCEPDTNVEKVIEDVIRVYGKTQGEWVGGYDADTLIVNLRRAFNKKEQKPAEWSEEDKKILDSLIRLYNREYSAYAWPWADGAITYGDVVNFLKSLRPSWKPSEEQMKALKDAKIRMSLEGWGLCPLLQSLINELESL